MTNKRILILLPLVFLAFGCNRTTEVPGLPSGTVTVSGQTLNVQIAESQEARQHGLSGTTSLAENDGMIFIFPSPNIYGFWMKDMNFPLDFIWIANGQVMEITSDVQTQPGVPDSQLQNYYPHEPIDSMIEVNAGWAKKNLLDVGDSAVLKR